MQFSTGAHLAAEVCRAGLKCCKVLSVWDSPIGSLVMKDLAAEFCATVQHNNQAKDQAKAVQEVLMTFFIYFPLHYYNRVCLSGCLSVHRPSKH